MSRRKSRKLSGTDAEHGDGAVEARIALNRSLDRASDGIENNNCQWVFFSLWKASQYFGELQGHTGGKSRTPARLSKTRDWFSDHCVLEFPARPGIKKSIGVPTPPTGSTRNLRRS